MAKKHVASEIEPTHLRFMLTKNEWSYQDAADHFTCARSAVCRWAKDKGEKGHRGMPDDVKQKVADILNGNF